ncbi:LysE family translocator [Arcticibacterium luteifluviistationis]|uniref:Homoserine lactone transporter n=1 Tax=Arcticibacterium luteifluviistationis TaxID=1784714 RepID=A0A2Z4G7F2_9BACT|nr:LysE family translocator [Arcticibacterium luteifluviistationis]AWV97020.1 homoserine lactone transporter [Arcticibacterium luteifluviistationis]
MFGIINFGAFVLSGMLVNVAPGADTMFILGRSISQGRKSGIYSALGILGGALIHCIMAAFGLSILLAKSALAFSIVKYLGAAYLIFLGLKLLFSKGAKLGETETAIKTESLKKIFWSGVLTDLLNPKVALFFLAFLPQFINPEYAENAIPFLILGFTFLFTGAIWCIGVAIFAARLSNKFRENPKIKYWLDKSTGGIFLALGAKLAFSKS